MEVLFNGAEDVRPTTAEEEGEEKGEEEEEEKEVDVDVDVDGVKEDEGVEVELVIEVGEKLEEEADVEKVDVDEACVSYPEGL